MADSKTILVISPHPDDESIGCGGTLAQHIAAGECVHAVFLTSGENGGHGRPPEETGPLREAEARDAAAILGIGTVDFWHEPDGSLQLEPRLVRRMRTLIEELRPRVIYVPHDLEMHPDHRAAAMIVQSAVGGAAEAIAKEVIPEVFMYEIWTPVQTIDHIVDISDTLELKLTAIRAHKSQCEVMDFDQASKGLARYRGEMHLWPGGEYAEAFSQFRLPCTTAPTGVREGEAPR